LFNFGLLTVADSRGAAANGVACSVCILSTERPLRFTVVLTPGNDRTFSHLLEPTSIMIRGTGVSCYLTKINDYDQFLVVGSVR